jgi:hypothetical protein
MRIRRYCAALSILVFVVGAAARPANAAGILHRFFVTNESKNCLTVAVQQRGPYATHQFPAVRPGMTLNDYASFSTDVHEFFIEWTVWRCDTSRGLKLLAPVYTGWRIDVSPGTTSKYTVRPYNSTYEMVR